MTPSRTKFGEEAERPKKGNAEKANTWQATEDVGERGRERGWEVAWDAEMSALGTGWEGGGVERQERETPTPTEVNTERATLPSTRTSVAEEGGQEMHLSLQPPLRVPPNGRAGFAGRSDPSLGTCTKREKAATSNLPHLSGSECRGHGVRGHGEGNGLVP